MSEELTDENNYKNTPFIILLSLIFFMQYFQKSNENKKELNEEKKAIANKLFWKYLFVFNLAKSADWCLGPFVHEFFNGYHKMSVEGTAKMICISFASNLFIGPSLIGYLNDGKNKKIPMIMYCFVLGISCLIRLLKENMLALIFSQMMFGVGSSILYSSFENWFVTESDKLNDKEVKDYLLVTAFEKSMVSDALIAVLVTYITGYLKVSHFFYKKHLYGITAPYIFSSTLCLMTFIAILFLSNISNDNVNDTNKNEDQVKNTDT